jgi:hypothetical protein
MVEFVLSYLEEHGSYRHEQMMHCDMAFYGPIDFTDAKNDSTRIQCNGLARSPEESQKK